MNSVAARSAWNVLKRAGEGVESMALTVGHRHEQSRGIRVKVLNGNLEWALMVMQRKMTSSGIERMIKPEQTHHLKNSEKRILARKNLEQKLRSQDLATQGRPPQESQRPVRISFKQMLPGPLLLRL